MIIQESASSVMDREVKHLIWSTKRNYETEISKERLKRNENFLKKIVDSNKQIISGITPLADNSGTLMTPDKNLTTILYNYFSSEANLEVNGNKNSKASGESQYYPESFKIMSEEIIK